MLDLDKVRLVIGECALEGHLVGSNLEHSQVWLAVSKFLAIIVVADSITKQAFTLFKWLRFHGQFMPKEYLS